MTGYEIHFFEAATEYFRKKNNKSINWEERRFNLAKEIFVEIVKDSGTDDICSADVSTAVSIADKFIETYKRL